MSISIDDYVNQSTFNQLLEMDDDNSRDFSQSIYTDFKADADFTFSSLDGSLSAGNLDALYKESRYLKSNAFALGLDKLGGSAYFIQHTAKNEDVDGNRLNQSEAALLQKIAKELPVTKDYFRVSCEIMDKFFEKGEF